MPHGGASDRSHPRPLSRACAGVLLERVANVGDELLADRLPIPLSGGTLDDLEDQELERLGEHVRVAVVVREALVQQLSDLVGERDVCERLR